MDVNSTLTRHFRSLSLEEKFRQQRADRPIVPLRRPVVPAPTDAEQGPHAAAVAPTTSSALSVNGTARELTLASEAKRACKRPAEVPLDALEPVAAEAKTHKRPSVGHTPTKHQAADFVVHHDYLTHAAGTSTFQPALPRPTLRPLRCDRLDQAQRRQLLQVARELTQATTRSGARTVLERATAGVEEQVRGKATR